MKNPDAPPFGCPREAVRLWTRRKPRHAAGSLPSQVKLAFPRGNAYPLGLEKEAMMDTTTLLIIVIILVIVLGGGWYGRGRWF
jgi:hypothetical protein